MDPLAQLMQVQAELEITREALASVEHQLEDERRLACEAKIRIWNEAVESCAEAALGWTGTESAVTEIRLLRK